MTQRVVEVPTSKPDLFNSPGSVSGLSMPVGTLKPITIDTSEGDVVITAPIRMITAITGSVIYVDITGKDGTASNVPTPPNLPCVNIRKVYKTGTDCTLMLGWPVE